MADLPALMTFDIFGTVLDWRTGLGNACRSAGRPLQDGEFDRIVDAQAALEQGAYLDYATILCRSLTAVIGLSVAKAIDVADSVGGWPFYADAVLFPDLMKVASCAAMTNSDRSHGEKLQARLGRLDDWLCSEDTRAYKPDPDFWHQMGRRRGIKPGPHWWHVSAYADYDLKVADELGLTTVFVERPHARPGQETHRVGGLLGLLDVLSDIAFRNTATPIEDQLMSGTGPAESETADTNLAKARQSVEHAETGDSSGIEQLDDVQKSDPASVEAVEQEASDGPDGRGLSR